MRTPRTLNICVAVCVFSAVVAGPAAGRILKVDRNGPPYKVECADGSAYFSSIQLAIDNAVNGDEIAVGPGTYYEAIDFKGKAIRLYSTGGPDVTTINGSGNIADNFGDGNYNGWKIVDEGNAGCPSTWSVLVFFNYTWMVQTSNIHTEPRAGTTRRGTYALWQESFYWNNYEINLRMYSSDNDMMGVMFRYQDHDNYYRFSWDRDRSDMWLGKMVNGQFTLLANKNKGYVADTWYNIKIIANGQNLSVNINGLNELNVQDSSFGYGPMTLYCWGNEAVAFDDVTVERIDQQYHAVQCVNGEGPGTILEGFTITGGNADGTDPNDQRGGGMYNFQSSPTVINCKFTGNTAQYGGGGMFNYNSSPTVTNCTFSSNTASDGGGMCNNNSSPTLTTCTFTDNSADYGGGMECNAGNPTITNCTFTSNSADVTGGGMYNGANSSPTVANCTFTGNSAFYGGGGMYNDSSSATVTACTFSGNEADSYGGAMLNDRGSVSVTGCMFTGNLAGEGGGGMCNNNSNPTVTNCNFIGDTSSLHGGGMSNNASSPKLTNCVFSGNTAGGHGGGMINSVSSSPTVTNCTFSGNMAGFNGDGIFNNDNSNPIVTNCIFWGDTPEEISVLASTPIVTYSDVQGGYPDPNGTNIDMDPCFVHAAAGDLRIAWPGSPCVDAGDNGAPNLPETDLDGNPRVINGNWDAAAVVDMGAYEHWGPTTLLRVDIAPQGAADAGAAWRFAGQTQWHDTGDAIYDLAPGYYDVEFKEIPGWTEPKTLAVRVLAATLTRQAGEYKRIPRFDIGQIPPRDAPHGRELAFYVYSEDLGPTATLSAVVDHWPQGPLYFDPDSGLFTYEPNDTDDRTPFFVAFNAETAGADPCSQVVEITPVPDLPPESAIVSRATQPFPDPCSRDYLFVNEIDLQDPGDPNTFIWFNATKRATRSITIGGKTLVLEAGSGHNTLYSDYHNNPDINDMTIHAETVIIRDPLALPQTKVTIYARDLRFEDDGSIDTTPLGDWLPVHIDGQYHGEDPPVDGNDGHPAGDISLYIGDFQADPGGGLRLIMNGGKGQYPEPGRNGDDGTNVPLATGWPEAPGRPSNVTFITAYPEDVDFYSGDCRRRSPYYSPEHADPDLAIPTAGTDAIPAGKPGNGGAGGDLISALDLSAYVQCLGGQSGELDNDGNDYTGGQNGGPNPAYHSIAHHHTCGDVYYWCWHRCEIAPIERWWREEHQAKTYLKYWAGPTFSGAAPPADVPVGPPGKTVHKPRAFAWLSPYALKMVVAHAKDAYLYGYAVEARDILQEYYELLETYMDLAEWSGLDGQWRLEFEQTHHEIGTLLHRLASGLDYFGNPPDWVPILSFEVLKEVYEQEIDHAIRVLYLSYWLQNKADDLTRTQNALGKGREKLWDQTVRFRDDYETVAGIIGPLKTEAAKIATKIGRADPGGCSGLLCQLKEKEAELVKRADEDVQARSELPTWKKALRACGTIISSVGAGGAMGAGGAAGVVTGIAGGGVTAVTDEFLADPDPWPQINMRTDVVKQFNSIEFDEAATGWLENFDDIENLSQIEDQGAEDCLATMRNDANQMASGLYDIKEALMTTSLSNEEVEARLKEIKAENPEFNRFVDDITELMVQKEVFNRQLAASMQKVSTLAGGITNNLLAIDAMNRNASHLSRILDPRAIMYVKDMERRALERLQKYHYYMAKAYEYRLLEPYPGDLNIQLMFNKIRDIVDDPCDLGTIDGSLGPADFDALKVVYEEQLRDLAENIIDRFMEGDYGYQQTTSCRLSPREIVQLNSTNQVTVNFVEKGLIPSSRENVRIVNLTVSKLDARIVGPSPVSFGQLIVKTQHSGLSRIQDANQIFLFRHTNPNSPKHEMLDISWLCEWDIIGDEIQQREMSDASKSLLAAVVGDDVYEYGYVLLSRPSAWADILISKEVNADTDCTIDIEPNGLTLQVKYDYYDKDPLLGLKTLVVSTEPNGPDWGVTPYFVVDRPDQSNRQDGIGSFRRMYECWNPEPVGITAPETHGCWWFDRWMDKSGTLLGTNPRLVITLDCDGPYERSIRARYNYEGPPLSPADFDESAYVDFSDFDALASKWYTISADPHWDDKYDISETADGVIDMRDVAAFAEGWLAIP